MKDKGFIYISQEIFEKHVVESRMQDGSLSFFVTC